MDFIVALNGLAASLAIFIVPFGVGFALGVLYVEGKLDALRYGSRR